MRCRISPLIALLAGNFVVGVASTSLFDASSAAPELRGKRSHYKRDGVKRTIFEHDATNSSIDFVTNSGICETTPGVNQYSGYLSTGKNQSLWFWFFESRNDPQNAPLATWFNGGPGCSSMIGLFQENGPCHFEDNATEPSLNPYSWNTYANMLYIDQPFTVGFSNEFPISESGDLSDSPLYVNGTYSAATTVWKLLQAFYAQFPQYKNRDFGIFTESYGGHYGPEFASYFESQNAAIAAGSVTGQNISLVALGINNGWYDEGIQEKAYIDFSLNNSYAPLINQSMYTTIMNKYTTSCVPAVQQCTNLTGENQSCREADAICETVIDQPLYDSFSEDFNVYDVRPNATQPSEAYVDYLNRDDVIKAIGAKSDYQECSNDVSSDFGDTGDHARSLLSALSSVVQSGVQTVIYHGDADFICNWFGGLAAVDAVNFTGADTFRNMAVSNYTVNGTAGGTFKTVDNFSWLRVFGAGHEVPFYQPQVALQVFNQTIRRQGLFSTKADGQSGNGTGNGTTGSGGKGGKSGSGRSAQPGSLALFVCFFFAVVVFG